MVGTVGEDVGPWVDASVWTVVEAGVVACDVVLVVVLVVACGVVLVVVVVGTSDDCMK